MLCEECGKRPATVHLTKIMNDQKTETHLCQECAQTKTEAGFMSEPNFTFHNILAGMFDPESIPAPQKITRPQVKCENCGLTFADFRRLGHLGCSQCYFQFSKQLEPLLRRIQGGTSHPGKVPARKGGTAVLRKERERLKAELEEAVRREEYERAAVLRDELRDLEKKIETRQQES